jgi:molybdopterin converting factor small subunit
MMPCIHLFGNLRNHAETPEYEVLGDSVREVLDTLIAQEPELRNAVFTGDDFQPYVRVMVDGQDIEFLQGLDIPVEISSRISIFPPLAGG